jgi:hypothetical protein
METATDLLINLTILVVIFAASELTCPYLIIICL